jgi:hypothetical protein
MIRNAGFIIIASIHLFFFQDAIIAQAKHDMSLQYCLATTPEIFDASRDLITSSYDDKEFTRSNTHWTGGFYGTYRYFFTDIQSVDAVFGYSRTRGDLLSGDEKQGESMRDFYTVAVEWSIHYIRKEYFQMYSGGGLGVTFIFEDNSFFQAAERSYSDSKVYPNFDFTFVGFRFGRRIAGFVETGIGYKGLIAFGCSAQF